MLQRTIQLEYCKAFAKLLPLQGNVGMVARSFPASYSPAGPRFFSLPKGGLGQSNTIVISHWFC